MDGDENARTQELFPLEEGPASAPAPADGAVPPAGPRVRWAGIVWGLALAALAAYGVWLAGTPGRLDELAALAPQISPTGLVAAVALTLGALVLVTGLVGLLRRAQRAVARRRG